jgi:hypothetical protein
MISKYNLEFKEIVSVIILGNHFIEKELRACAGIPDLPSFSSQVFHSKMRKSFS